MGVPEEDRTIGKFNLTAVSAPVSVEEIRSDSENEDTNSRSNSPIIPARSLGVSLSRCCFRGIKVCFFIFVCLFAAVISQSPSVGRESSKSAWAKRYATKIKPTVASIPLAIPLLGEKRKAAAPLTIQKDVKRKRADILDKEFASKTDDSVNVVWPEMKHLLNEDVFEGYKDWDMEDIVNEAGANAYKVNI